MKGVKAVLIIGIIALLTFSFMSIAFNNQTITVGYYEDYPLVFDEQGEAKGFLVDLIKDFAKENNYEVAFEYNYWENSLEKLENNEIDLLLDIVYTPERDEIYDFSREPLVLNWGKIAVDKKYNVKSILDLEDMTIGYLPNDYYFLSEEGIKEQIEAFQINVNWIGYKSYDEIIEAINNGLLDGGVLNRFSINRIYDYQKIEEAPINFSASNILVAANEGENEVLLTAFDTYVKKVKSHDDSFYYERYNYWFNAVKREPMVVFYDENKSYIILGLLLLFLTILVSRYKVSQKVKKISKTNKTLKEINQSIAYDQELIDKATKEMDETYKTTEKTSNRFRQMVTFLAKEMPIQKKQAATDFLRDLFNQSIKLIDDLDYAAVFYYNGGPWPYVTDTKTLKGEVLKNVDLSELFSKSSQVITKKNFTLGSGNAQRVLNQIDGHLGNHKKKALISIWYKDEIKAGMVFLKTQDHSFNPGDLRIIQSIKNIAESYFVNQSFKKATLNFQKEIVFSLVEMLEIHDDYTRGHSEIVANLAKNFAEYLGLEKEHVDEIYWAALLHDIGKILVDQEILKKEKKLSISEEELVRKHSLYGYAALNQSKATAKIAKYVLYHHERYDGEGYPYGLKGKDIPLGSHIIFLADTYDAMGSKRSYKAALNEEEIIEEIENNLGSQYDPDIGRKFLEMLNSGASDKR